MNNKTHIYEPFQPPFEYDDEGYSVVDIKGNKILDISG